MSWPFVAIGDVAEILSGNAWKSSQFTNESEGRLPIIRIQNISDIATDFIYWDGVVLEKYIIKDGDLLLSVSGNVKLCEWSFGNALLNQRIVKLAPAACIDKRYFYWALHRVAAEIEAMARHAVIANVSVTDLREFQIPLPPLPEQKRIAAILDKADSVRRKRQQAIQLADDFLRAVFLDMFGDPVTNPKGWDLLPFSAVGTLDRGKSRHRPRNDPALLGGAHPLIQTGEVANSRGYIKEHSATYSDLGLAQSKKWDAGTLCITIAANIAKTGILTFPACFPDSVVGFIPNKHVTVEYVQHWLGFLQKNLEENAPQAAQKNINLEILRALLIPVPPKSEQEKFSSMVAGILTIEEKIASSSDALGNAFDALSQKAFSGQL